MKVHSLVAFSVAALLGAGCTVSTGPSNNTTLGSGRVEVSWTIALSSDPAACTNFRVGTARVELFDVNNVKMNAGADTQTCTTFATSFPNAFPEGSYTVQVTLIGLDGTTARTTSVRVPVAVPRNGNTVKVPVDFGNASFFP